MALLKVNWVRFTPETRFILTDKKGNQFESQAIVFWPDDEQTTLYDTRQDSIMVSRGTVWVNSANGYPSGIVKFPPKRLKMKDVVAFEVVGAKKEGE